MLWNRLHRRTFCCIWLQVIRTNVLSEQLFVELLYTYKAQKYFQIQKNNVEKNLHKCTCKPFTGKLFVLVLRYRLMQWPRLFYWCTTIYMTIMSVCFISLNVWSVTTIESVGLCFQTAPYPDYGDPPLPPSPFKGMTCPFITSSLPVYLFTLLSSRR